eukprot:scaffold10473_cov98-Cylindrotheca_fusiformis.AAC.1
MEEALRRFVRTTKHIHSDVKWHHFGYYGKEGEEKLYMCNLFRIERCEDEAKQEEWVKESLGILRDWITFEPPPRVLVSSSEQLEDTNRNEPTPSTPRTTSTMQRLSDSSEGETVAPKRQKL